MPYGQVDPGVIMAAGQPTVQRINPMDAAGQAMSLQQLQQNIKLKQQEVQQNAMSMRDQQELMRAYQVPDNVDPQTGMLKPAAIQGISNPQMKQKLISGYNDAQYQIEQRKNLASKEAIASNKLRMEEEKDMREKLQATYDATLQSTGDQNAATKAFMDAQKDGIKDLKANGVFPENYQFKMLDPKANATSLQTYKERQDAIDKHTKDQRDERHQKFEEGIQGANLNIARSREAREQKKDSEVGIGVVPKEYADLHGPDYLATVPAGLASTVKAIAEGRETFSSLGIRGKDREAMVERVNQYDPEYDQGMAPAKFAVRKDFTSGPTSKNITSINTSIHHVGTLEEMVDALKNGDTKAVNYIINKVKTETGNPNINNLELAKNAVGDELMKAFRGAGASESEAESWRKKFDTSNSPETLKEAGQTAVKLLHGRITEVDNQWKRGMSTEKGYPNLLSPEAKGVLDKLEGGTKQGGDLSVTAPNGKVYHFKDKAQADAFKKAAGL